MLNAGLAQGGKEVQRRMSHYDVFNGDADGICALHQLRLANPQPAVLVTGVKRDIQLLDRVAAQAGDSVTVLDISLDRNRAALVGLLERGVRVEYFDHHFAGAIPQHPGLRSHIDPAPGSCTSTLVDRHLQGRHRLWAVVAAFGDNLHDTANALARTCGLTQDRVLCLHDLGQGINYNAYGDSEADLLIPPANLYRALQPYADPFDFIARDPSARLLTECRRQDMAHAGDIAAAYRLPAGTVHVLPDAAWARRVQGEFANDAGGAVAGSGPRRALRTRRARLQRERARPAGPPRGRGPPVPAISGRGRPRRCGRHRPARDRAAAGIHPRVQRSLRPRAGCRGFLIRANRLSSGAVCAGPGAAC